MEKIKPSYLNGPLSLKSAIQFGKMLEPVFRIKDTGIDSKIYHTWRMAGLVDTIEDGKWANFSFVEYLWLQTLDAMRKLGCGVKIMKTVHQELFIRAYEEKLAEKTLQENIKFLKTLSGTRPLTKNEEEILTHSINTLNDKVLMSVTRLDITYFYQLVVKCFTNNNEVGIVIFEDHSFSTYEKSSYIHAESVLLDLSVPHIRIPISHFIKGFIVNEEKEKFLVPTGVITDDEFKVIHLIRNKNVGKLIISFNGENQPVKFESEETGIIQGEKAKRVMQYLGMKNYSSVELKTRDGKTLSFSLNSRELL
jgi:hypothetical protein